MRECHFCDESEALDTHHIVPRRYGGSDRGENLVTVCPNCHRKLETLYDERFYTTLGISEGDVSPSRVYFDVDLHDFVEVYAEHTSREGWLTMVKVVNAIGEQNSAIVTESELKRCVDGCVELIIQKLDRHGLIYRPYGNGLELVEKDFPLQFEVAAEMYELPHPDRSGFDENANARNDDPPGTETPGTE
jgi:hypothetical protein